MSYVVGYQPGRVTQVRRRFSAAQARVLCYVLPPLTSVWLLRLHDYGRLWSVRFHAFHSVLITTCWAAAWGCLRSIEEISPWLLATLVRELRFAMNLGFLLVWVSLLSTAYRGQRCAVIPFLHSLAVKLARRHNSTLRA